MSLERERDVALVGTGLAPLLAAQAYLRKGFSVLLLNPEPDFFGEDSELPMDPTVAVDPRSPDVLKSLELMRSEKMAGLLGPEFPGSLESWSRENASSYFDPKAPFVRSRSWNWVGAPDADGAFLEFEARGWRPQFTEGLASGRRIPGFTHKTGEEPPFRALSLPRMGDVDVDRYRNGVLEFVRSRLDAADFVDAAGLIEPTADGVRFYQSGTPRSVRLKHGVRVFHTPRLGPWMQSIGLAGPRDLPAVASWEEWTLISRDPLDASQLGIVGDAFVWARCEGAPVGPIHELAVLMPVLPGEKPASAASFMRLGSLVQRILNWDRFSARDLRQRRLSARLPRVDSPAGRGRLAWLPGCDGALVAIVEEVGRFCAEGET